MELHPIKESSHIAAVGYDPSKKTLRIRFKIGSVFDYHDVPPQVHSDLVSAKSAGKFFHRQIRNNYKWDKVLNEEP
jgi:KTSC domain